jgi:hypothetical protein
MPDFGESELLRTVHGTFPLFDKQDPARMEAGSDHTFYFSQSNTFSHNTLFII